MPWQQLVADIAGEIDPDTGYLVYREVRLTLPRQSGKTTLWLPTAVDRATGWESRQRIVYTAQRRKDAADKFVNEHIPLLSKSVFRDLYRSTLAPGGEMLRWANGSLYGIDAVTETAGHGPTVDLANIDEAWAQPDARVEQAVKPAMITRPDAQLWIVSTAGTQHSAYLRRKVEDGRARVEAGQNRRIAYFEWSAADDADPDDPATWWSCMPALGHTVTEDAVAAERESMDDDEFRRAFCNQWRDQKAPVQVIPADAWADAMDETSAIAGRPVYSIDVTPNREWSAIAAGGHRTDGLEHAEIIAHEAGTAWVVQRLKDIRARNGGNVVVLDPAGPVASLIPDLEDAEFEVLKVSARQMAQACGALYDAVVMEPSRFRHRGEIAITSAMAGAVKRKLGDAWAWSRADSVTDICPLVALTLARWGHTVAPDETYDVLQSIW
jgi:phage terminase large subunit-like protein